MESIKTPADSRVEQAHILSSGHTSGKHRMLGGQLMAWIDEVAAVVARRHARAEVTTAAVDNLQFEAPAYVDSTILLIGRLIYVGSSSMEVRVDTFVESLDGKRERVNTAYLVMVAIDEHSRPIRVPRLNLTTDEQRREWAAAEKRTALRKQRRAEQSQPPNP